MASRVGLIVAGAVVLAVAAAAAVLLTAPGRGAGPAATVAATGAAAQTTPRPETDVGKGLMAQAEQLYNRGDAVGAAAAYDKAQTAYRKAGDVRGEAGVAYGLGRMNHGSGQSDKARADYGRAVGLYQQAGDLAGQARVLVAMADLEKDTFHGPLAAKYYRQARETWARAPDPKSDTHPILNIDRAPEMPAGEDKARALLAQATKTFGNIGDREGEGDVAMLVAALEAKLGNEKPSHAAYQSARNLYSMAGQPAKEAMAQLAFAAGDIRFGYNVSAAEDLADAQSLLAGDPVGLARVSAVRGDLERLQGRLAEARQAYDTALPILTTAKHPDEPLVRLHLGQVQALLGDATAAQKSVEVALSRFRELGAVAGESAAQLQLGLLALAAGAIDRAGPALAVAAERAHAAGDSLGEARALLASAEVAAKQSNTAATATALASSAERFAAAKTPFGSVLVNLARGDAARATNDAAGAVAAYRQASAALTQIEEPLAEASRVLGQPAVGRLWLLIEAEERVDGAVPDPEVVRAAKAADAANVAAYAGFNPDGRALLAATQARLTAALATAN